MPALSHPHPLPHALRLDLLPDPVARTGTPLSRSSSPSPGVHTPQSAGGGQQRSPVPLPHPLHHPLPQLYPAHSTVAPAATTLLTAQPSSPAAASSSPSYTTPALSSTSSSSCRASGGTFSPSPPTTPTPFAADRAGAVAVDLRETEDREGVHQTDGHQGVDGLEHAPGWVEAREVLDVKGGTKVRAISADDYAKLEQLHLSLDVPETTLFPWLHGMGDGNRLLDEFFSSFPGYRAQFPAPRYRGLTTLLAPGPGDSRPVSSSQNSPARPNDGNGGRWDELVGAEGRRRGGSLASDFSSAESENSWAHSDVSSFPTSISSFSSSLSAASTPSCKPEHPNGPPVTATSSSAAAGSGPVKVDASTGSVGLTAAPTAAYDAHHSAAQTQAGSDATLPSLLTSAVPAEEIITLTPHAPRRVGAPPPTSPAHPQQQRAGDDRLAGDELARMPLGKKGAVRGVFRRRDVGDGTISLRNLSVQGKKYATISDIVVYHPDGFCTSALNVAERCAEAAEAVYEERKRALAGTYDEHGEPVEPVRYNVFLVAEPFSVFEEKHPELVAVDARGQIRNKVDLFAQEKRENGELTQAREVSPGFWMGNSNDCPVLNGVNQEAADDAELATGENRLGVHVCIEAFDDAEMPDPHRLRHASQYLATLPAASAAQQAPQQAQHVRHDSLSDAAASLALHSPPTTKATFDAPPPAPPTADAPMADAFAESKPLPGQVYHLQCVSTSLVVPPGDWRGLNALAGQTVDFVKWVKATVDDGRRVLVHGYDGYTETSIFALAYIMHAHALTLPEAYIHLHLDSGRSFFVYPHDLPLLRRIEDRIISDARALASPAPSVQPQHAAGSSLSGGGNNAGGGQKWKAMLGGWKLGHYGAESTASATARVTADAERREKEERELASKHAHNAWFNHPCFEGSLPSRILDFLYLGNLNHASNPGMLHALGITHVVSVGESALLDPASAQEGQPGGSPYGACSPGASSPNHDLWYEHQAGRIKVLDMQSICDDGVSPLRPCIALAVEWMEHARRDGGKILVHCKVGVSRSATVTVAYLMKYCGYTLIDAYMLVRARRLNVLIQPNLKFMFELQGWEVELSREKAELENGVHMTRKANGEAVAEGPRQHGTKSMSWPIMAKAMAHLNHRYLGGNLH